ncbi:4Fe-4S dicluster domain-containing protein [Thermodesulfatator autotrophicus]|uniref:Heterodisulfide reductase n=1 Tax=Thermodesulfatator autotrophicus TaxID=1795632 RepID=A0A177E4I3_9BACT|nr:4Fe-4S dicluster domain-containing protein [Thermodesulfatator autotrophicus]OAG26873.1 heterodisulfide reductase [Thermodesulfatator autotrophicus]
MYEGVVVLNEKDRELAIKTIMERGGDGVLRCIQCGACQSTCPMAFADFTLNPRKLIRLIQLGFLEEMIEDSSTWACQACNRCVEICPRNVKPFEIVFAYRRYQAMELAFSTSAVQSQMNLYMKGHAVFSEAYKETRQKVGLPPETPTAVSYPEALKEIQTLIENSPIMELGLF